MAGSKYKGATGTNYNQYSLVGNTNWRSWPFTEESDTYYAGFGNWSRPTSGRFDKKNYRPKQTTEGDLEDGYSPVVRGRPEYPGSLPPAEEEVPIAARVPQARPNMKPLVVPITKYTDRKGKARITKAIVRELSYRASGGRSVSGSRDGGGARGGYGNSYGSGGYQGGTYGGAAGRAINEGVGGAYKNR